MSKVYLNFEILPNDLKKDCIIYFLGLCELINLSETSCKYRSLLKNNEIWRNLITRDFGIKINKEMYNMFKSSGTLEKMSYYNIYKYIYKIGKFDKYSMDIMKQIYSITKEKTILLMLNRLTMISTVKQLLSLRKQCYVICKEEIENNKNKDIRTIIFKIKELVKERIYMKTISEIRINGNQILKQLYDRKNRKCYTKLKNILISIDLDLYQKLNSRTPKSYWFIASLLEKYYYDEKFFIWIKSAINTETKKFLSNFHNDLILYIVHIIPDIKSQYNINQSPILRKYNNKHTLSLWLISYVVFNKLQDYYKDSNIIYNETAIFLQNSCSSFFTINELTYLKNRYLLDVFTKLLK